MVPGKRPTLRAVTGLANRTLLAGEMSVGLTIRLLTVLALGSAQLAAQAAQPGSAQELWDDYVELGTAFDPSLAELYANDAVIHLTRRYPDGHTRTLELN